MNKHKVKNNLIIKGASENKNHVVLQVILVLSLAILIVTNS